MRNSLITAAVRAALVVSAGLTCAATVPALGADAAEETGPAANSAGPGQPAELEEVVVSGYAYSLERALETKRLADVVSDGISAEDIGQYPEQNIAESLQRVTGVQITRSLGDGQYISVRGLDPKFTDTLYNGRQLPSASGTRAFDFQVLTSNFASQVDVYKSPTADMLESGLAATVNMQSFRPLTVGKTKAAFTAEGVYDEQGKRGVQPHLSAFYTDIFLDDRLGWSVAVDLNRRNLDDQQMSSDGVNTDSTYTGTPSQYRVFGIHQNDLVGTDSRLSATSMLQFKVNDSLELRLDSIVSRFEQRYNYYQGNNWYPAAGALGASPTTSETVDSNNVETAWSGSNVFSWVQANFFQFTQQMNSTALAATWTPGNWKVDAEGSFGKATERTTQAYVSWATAAPGADLYYDTTKDPNGPISFGFTNGFDPNDISHYYFFGVQGSYQEPTTDKIWTVKLDAVRTLDMPWLPSFRIGANFEDRTLATTPNYITNTNAGFPADMSQYLTVYHNSSYFSSYNGGAQFPTSYLTVNLNKFFQDYPLSKFVAANPPQQSLTTTTVVEEKSEAAYARLDMESPDKRLKGNIGLRAVHTEELSSGYVPTPDATLIYGLFGGANSLSYSDAAIQAQKQTYNNILPSLNLSYLVTNDLIARFAAARVMQRPDMNLLAAASSPNASSGPPPSGTWIGTLQKGNPGLQPYLSNQLDLSLEWYFSPRGLLAGDVFLKDVKNLVLTNYHTETENVTLAGTSNSSYPTGTVLPIALSVAQPVNAQATKIKGAEVGYQQSFGFLPSIFHSLGAQANYTHIWSGTVVLNQGQPAVPLTGISNSSYNLGAYYDDGRLDIHAVYNYRSKWVYDPLSYFGDGIYVKGYGQLDLSSNFKLNPHLSVNASAQNVTRSALQQEDRYGINRLYDLSGRRYYLGIRASL